MGDILYFDVCAIIILGIMLCSFLVRTLNSERTNIVFAVLLLFAMIASITDLTSLLFGTVIPEEPGNTGIRYALDYVYFVSRNCCAPLLMFYTVSYTGTWHIYVKNRIKIALLIAPIACGLFLIVTNPLTHFIFMIDDNCRYSRGPLMPLLYVISLFYVIMGLVLLVMYRKLMNRDKFITLMFQFPVCFVALGIQFFYPHLLVEMFGTAIQLLIIFSIIQRGEDIIDPVSGVQNYNAAISALKKAFDTNQSFRVIYISLTNHVTVRTYLGMDRFNHMLKSLGDRFSKICHAHKVRGDIYYLMNGTYAIIVDDDNMEAINATATAISAGFDKAFDVDGLRTEIICKTCIIRCPEDIDDYTGIVNFESTLIKALPDSEKVVFLSEVADSKDFKLKNDLDMVIANAIENHKFQMYYQPIYSAKKMKFVSAEALIRLIDDKYGFVSPGLFIPHAEESGAIHQIGDYVLDDVCRFLSECNMKKIGLDYVEINLSVAQCVEDKLDEKIMANLNKYNLSVDSINLEITETAADFDQTAVDKNVKALAEQGVKFSLDDYGTGYSNIKRVTKLPLNIVKLDKSFVDEMDDPTMWIVIKNTVNMLHEMKKEVLVEGVETKETLEKFLDIGCEYIQGYYFSRPLPEDEFVKFMMEHN